MISGKKFLIVLLIVFVAAFLRLYELKSAPPGLYPDEAMNGSNAQESLETGKWKVFYPENNGREGLFMNLQALSLLVIGQNEPWVLRLPSAIFGTLTVIGFFLLLYELSILSRFRHPFTLAAFGALFLATSFWHINFSRIGFRAITAPFFLTWGVYFFLLSFRRRWFRAALLSGLALGLGLYSYIAYRIMPALVLVFFGPFYHRKEFWHIVVTVFITALIVFLPLGYFFLVHPADFMGRTSQVSVFSSKTPLNDLLKNTLLTLGMFNFRGDGNWRHNISGAPQVFWPVGILMAIGILIAIRRRSILDLTFLAWFCLALLPVVISNEGIPHALRAIIAIPAVFGFAASAAALIFEKLDLRIRSNRFLNWVVFIFGLLLFIQAYHAYFVTWAKNPNVPGAFASDYVAVAREIKEAPKGLPIYIVVEAAGVDVRGLPMPTQTVMFMTDTFLPENQMQKNIHYLTPSEYKKAVLPEGARVYTLH